MNLYPVILSMIIATQIDRIPIPGELFFYQLGNQKIFPLLGKDGDLTSGLGCYLMEELPKGFVPMGLEGLQERDGGRWYSILFCLEDSTIEIDRKIQKAIDTLIMKKTDHKK